MKAKLNKSKQQFKQCGHFPGKEGLSEKDIEWLIVKREFLFRNWDFQHDLRSLRRKRNNKDFPQIERGFLKKWNIDRNGFYKPDQKPAFVSNAEFGKITIQIDLDYPQEKIKSALQGIVEHWQEMYFEEIQDDLSLRNRLHDALWNRLKHKPEPVDLERSLHDKMKEHNLKSTKKRIQDLAVYSEYLQTWDAWEKSNEPIRRYFKRIAKDTNTKESTIKSRWYKAYELIYRKPYDKKDFDKKSLEVGYKKLCAVCNDPTCYIKKQSKTGDELLFQDDFCKAFLKFTRKPYMREQLRSEDLLDKIALQESHSRAKGIKKIETINIICRHCNTVYDATKDNQRCPFCHRLPTTK